VFYPFNLSLPPAFYEGPLFPIVYEVRFGRKLCLVRFPHTLIRLSLGHHAAVLGYPLPWRQKSNLASAPLPFFVPMVGVVTFSPFTHHQFSWVSGLNEYIQTLRCPGVFFFFLVTSFFLFPVSPPRFLVPTFLKISECPYKGLSLSSALAPDPPPL